jgi:L-lactate dehydrogenase complex protein LldG
MSEREKIFSRIREALTIHAHRPGHHSATGELPAGLPDITERRRVLPKVQSGESNLLGEFSKNAADLKAVFKPVSSEADLTAALAALAAQEQWQRIAAHRTNLVQRQTDALALPVMFTDAGYDKFALERCDAGISECDALVAQTGSVVITSRSAGGRALSVLPPHHIVLARREQMVADLPAAFERLRQIYGDTFPSLISFITGPSRTGDIERILVLGAHGPKKLTIFIF